jgi:hypothetical protein
MSKNTAWGNKAYKKARHNGGSKEEAKQASAQATERYHQQTRERQFGFCKDYNFDGHDFDSSINGNGAGWHLSEDL